jgi:hypothetical protein
VDGFHKQCGEDATRGYRAPCWSITKWKGRPGIEPSRKPGPKSSRSDPMNLRRGCRFYRTRTNRLKLQPVQSNNTVRQKERPLL